MKIFLTNSLWLLLQKLPKQTCINPTGFCCNRYGVRLMFKERYLPYLKESGKNPKLVRVMERAIKPPKYFKRLLSRFQRILKNTTQTAR